MALDGKSSIAHLISGVLDLDFISEMFLEVYLEIGHSLERCQCGLSLQQFSLYVDMLGGGFARSISHAHFQLGLSETWDN